MVANDVLNSPVQKVTAEQTGSYGTILKSSSLVGGAEGISVLLGMVRMKFAAVLIGPMGVGLAGSFMAIRTVIGQIAGLGLQTSAVRDIAAAAGREDWEKVGEIVRVLRRVVWFTGIVGALAMAALSGRLSAWTFGTSEYRMDIALLGLALLFANVQGGQIAYIQGMRRIADLAKLRIYEGIATTGIAIGFYLWLGLRGIIPALVLGALAGLLIATVYARKLEVSAASLTWRRTLELSGGMIRLGLALMWSAVLTALVAYLTRALIAQNLGLVEVGLFGAAFTLSGMFVNFVLQAMGADYYPRLTAAFPDHALMRRLVNEQAEIGLLLALPGLIATMVMAPWILKIFYTAEFAPAANLLQWFILGCVGRVISFPLGFIILALGNGRLFAITESAANLLHIILIWAGLHWIGLEGSAMAFFSLYVIYTVFMTALAYHLIGFRWSRVAAKLIFVLLLLAALAFIIERLLSPFEATALGLLLTAITFVYCLRGIVQRVGDDNAIVGYAMRVPGLRFLCQ